MLLSYHDFLDEIRNLLVTGDDTAIPIRIVAATDYQNHAHNYVTASQAAWLECTGWKAKSGAHVLLPGKNGIEAVLLMQPSENILAAALQIGGIASHLPEGTYVFESYPYPAEEIILAWLMANYAFTRYIKTPSRKLRKLCVPAYINVSKLVQQAQAIWFSRELINLPANELAPIELCQALADMGKNFGAKTEIIQGQVLIEQNFPMIYAVGQASDREPCLADLTWGNANHPKVTLVGKGICFDTGGLNIKPAQAMALMKKDMGGAASVIALAAMIMSAQLPIRLRVLIPAADNNISANAFRPGDILKSRSGMTVEIANTDAEGRLVLADALTLADQETPDLLIDIATLTGAARVALGPDVTPFYTDDDDLAETTQKRSFAIGDAVWRLPLWAGYDPYLKSKVADVNHIYNGPYAGSITAALFLKRFVKKAQRYMHFDIFGWVPKAQPGKPIGGEPQAARILFDIIKTKFSKVEQ